MFRFSHLNRLVTVVTLLSLVGAFTLVADASHSWGSYHWARTVNPFTLKLGDNVSFAWDPFLATASGDWTQSSILNTTVVSGSTDSRRCRATNGRVEVCSNRYGNNGWLGIASIWISGSHITKGTVRVNDTYFNTSRYNTPGWRGFVMCQEVGHTFGLDHQDEDFYNSNLGSCMDYSGDPDGTINGQLSNEHPNNHDYEQLETIYAHLDSSATLLSDRRGTAAGALALARANLEELDLNSPREWGRVIRTARDGRSSLYERDLGRGEKVFTFVIWAD
ncbi:hypothetical protein EPN83_01875 [Patescibacteria group bacterium]|nr:MAG: hypothetical protein EPN83_01875 [Patescibacteria group bacterium]